MKKTTIVIIILFPSIVIAKPAYLKKYKDAFPDKAGQSSCKTCHTVGSNLNKFGNAFYKAKYDFSIMEYPPVQANYSSGN